MYLYKILLYVRGIFGWFFEWLFNILYKYLLGYVEKSTE